MDRLFKSMNFTTTIEKTWKSHIYIGSKEGYTGPSFDYSDLRKEIGIFQMNNPEIACTVRVVAASYIFAEYEESGWEISIINYPRFPKSEEVLIDFTHGLAQHLLDRFKQNRMSIVFKDDTILLESKTAVI